MEEFIAFAALVLITFMFGVIFALTALLPDSPDPGYGYKWSCKGDKVVVQYAYDDEGSFMAGKLCERIKK